MRARRSGADARTPIGPVADRWKLFVALALPALLGAGLAACWPPALATLAVTRAGLLGGELWRLVTGHFIHIGPLHLLLNLAGLALLCELLCAPLSWRQAAIITLAGMFGIDLLLLAFSPEVGWYAGLSGLLHALWAGSAVLALRAPARWSGKGGPATPSAREVSDRDPAFFVAALLILAGKLLVEAWAGKAIAVDSAAAHLIGAPVVTVAHRYGALSGLLAALAMNACARRRSGSAEANSPVA